MRILLALGGVAAVILPIAEAHAQGLGTVRVRPGLGAQIRPEHLGSDKYEWAPLLRFSIATGERPFAIGAPGDGFGIGLLSKGGFSAGPSAAIEGKRKESDVGAPVGDVPTTIEVGAFAQHQFGDSFRLRGELRKGIGGHGGLVGTVAAHYIVRDGDRYAVIAGPRLRFSNARHQREYFGVSPEAAAASGLAPYRPGGGLYSAGVGTQAHYSLGGGWGLFGYGQYERLVGDARRSPIVRELGSANQYSAGIGISRTFTIRL